MTTPHSDGRRKVPTGDADTAPHDRPGRGASKVRDLEQWGIPNRLLDSIVNQEFTLYEIRDAVRGIGNGIWALVDALS